MALRSFFAAARRISSESIFAITAEYQQDSFPLKVNLGQGTYRDENGNPWLLNSVREARKQLNEEGLLHEYLPVLGLPSFRMAASELALGSGLFQRKQNYLASCQSISGTGALHLAGLLIRKCSDRSPKVYIPEPTWSNHVGVMSSLGFECHQFPYYDAMDKRLDIESYKDMLATAERGSVVILHACAHNPTGYDPSKEQWKVIGSIIKDRRLFPLFDAAYLGFNSGNIDQDAFAIRHFVGDLDLEIGICMSFAKNMGLYGERVGCTVFITNSKSSALDAQSNLEALQRSEVSSPPAFGARIASKILNDQSLKEAWYQDLIVMSSRIRSMRHALLENLLLAGATGSWDHLVAQSGMFGFLGLPREVVLELKERYHIYMAENSRISIAGLNDGNVEYVARSIAQCLRGRTMSSSLEDRARI